jgi:hypothetical protein
MNGSRRLLLALVFALAAASFASASDIYIAQNAQGGNTGADCADAQSVTWFNSAANWGSQAGQIGPGTTVHLCGTFTATAGTSSYLQFQGSGSSGNPVTLIADQGTTTITATYWSGPVINLNGQSYITINGDNNLTVQATANGSALANKQNGGICVQNHSSPTPTNIIIEGLTCSDLYVEGSLSDNGGQNTYGFDIWNSTNVTIQNNTIHDVKWAGRLSYAIGSTFSSPSATWTGNNEYNMDHGLFITDSDSGGTATVSGIFIYGNTYGSMANWDNTGNNNHHDWIVHLSTNSATSQFSNVFIYNNYASGDVGAYANAGIFAQPQTTTDYSTVYVFNNVMVNTGVTTHCFANGLISWYTAGSLLAANNTFVSDSASCVNNGNSMPGDNGIDYSGSVGLKLENNIMQNMQANGVETASGATVTTINYQDYYEVGGWTWFSDSQTSSFSTWKTDCSCDANSTTGNPLLTGTYHLTSSSSAAWQTGTNLTSTCSSQPNPGLGALCFDKNGTARPSSGSWDMGAYEDSVGGDPPPKPPTGLSAVVH